MNFGTEANNISSVFPGIEISLLTLDVNFKVPLFREYAMALGFCSVAKESILHILGKKEGGRGVILVPGGAREGHLIKI